MIISTAIALTLTLSGCATQVYTLQGGATKAEPTLNQTDNFFLHGVAQTKHVNAAKICGGAEYVAKVESTISPLNSLLAWITFNIYTPKQAKVYCVADRY